MIEILTSAPLATVQDLGREGYRRFGVGTAGAMDRLALQTANLMLGNDPNAAALEIPASPFALRFYRDVGFALTGADCAATLDDPDALPPTKQIQTAERLAWMKHMHELPEYERFPA